VVKPVPLRRTARQLDLLDRLVGLLLREGFADLTIEELATRLRCSKTTLYQLAPSKGELVTVAVRQFFRAATARVEDRIRVVDRPEQQVNAYLNAVAEELKPASQAFLADIALFAPAREVYQRNTRRAAERVRGFIADGVRSGAFRNVNAMFVAEVVTATMTQINSGEITERTGLSDADAYAELASLVLHALRA
jgi:AcrR family transcriptional regulator